MADQVYAITDVQGYVSQMREVAAKALSENSEQDDLDSYISLNQMINLLNEHCLGFDDNDRPLLNENANEKIFEETSVWIHSVGLAKLAAKDLVECAWDEQSNEMVFWAKETNKDEKPKQKRKRKNI
jgi:hypothetical protein